LLINIVNRNWLLSYKELQGDGSARAMGYRMPGEFEAVEAVWLTPPCNVDTWPGCFDEAVGQYEQFVKCVEKFTSVQRISGTNSHGWETHDSWVRDYGPVFVVHDGEEKKAVSREGLIREDDGVSLLACHDFTFNGWGNKYAAEGYKSGIDDVIPLDVAKYLDIGIWRHDLVLEGGSIDSNGNGVLLTTSQCLLHPNRNVHLSCNQIELQLRDALAAEKIIWLPGGIEGDDTDGHVDDVARFISPNAIVAIRAPKGHTDFGVLEQNWQVLEAARDTEGHAFELFELPVPELVYYDYPITDGGFDRRVVPASYANYLMVNDGVILPVFGQSHDDEAISAMSKALPGKTICPVRCEHLVVGLGAVHCLSMQQPAIARGSGDGAGNVGSR
jgi:agmatine deiminase